MQKLKLILFLVFIFWPGFLVQAGENLLRAEKIIRTNNQNLVFRLSTKAAVQIGQKTDFYLSVAQQPGEEMITKGQMSLEIKNETGELETFITAEEREKGVYSFSHSFRNPGDYRLLISFSPKEQKKLGYSFI